MRARRWIVVAGLLVGAVSCTDSVAAPPAATSQPPSARSDLQSSPQLLACPSTETQQTTGVIGLLGGVLSLGGTNVQIPFGAVLQPTLFQIVVPQSQYMEVDVHAVGLTSFLFHQPVDITIDYSRCGDDAVPSGAQLQGVYIDPASHTVLQEMGGTNDSVSH